MLFLINMGEKGEKAVKYRALRIVSVVYKVLAWIVIVIGVLSVCGVVGLTIMGGMGGVGLGGPITAPRGQPDIGGMFGIPFGGTSGIVGVVIVAVMIAIYFGIGALTFFAISEGIMLFIDLEENSERTVTLLERLAGGGISPGH